jgi:hypothetical protein
MALDLLSPQATLLVPAWNSRGLETYALACARPRLFDRRSARFTIRVRASEIHS